MNSTNTDFSTKTKTLSNLEREREREREENTIKLALCLVNEKVKSWIVFANQSKKKTTNFSTLKTR